MADAPEMLVVDPDAPTDQSVKQSLMSLPTWEEWLQKNGFTKGEKHRSAISAVEWNRDWPQHGRGWRLRVAPSSDTINIIVYRNTLGRSLRHEAMVSVAERSVVGIVTKLISEVERPVSDATKKRRIKAYTSTIPYADRDDKIEFINGPVLAPRHHMEAAPIRRPIPDDPAELDKPQMDQMLDRIQTTCFPKGQRVRVRRRNAGTLTNALGTVVSASPHACYVAIDHYVEAGDPDPFRFTEDELEPVYENQQEPDLDDPAPYIAALDYITPLKQLGYQALNRDYYTKHLHFNDEKQGVLTIGIKPMPNALSAMTVVIFLDYYQGGESERIGDMVVEAMGVIDRVRELEVLADSTANIAEFARKLAEKNYPDSSVFSHYDHLIYVFGESVLNEAENVDDPEFYLQDLQRHYEVINVLRKLGVRMGRRMGGERKYYRLFYIPSAVTDVSYDIYLQPMADNSYTVTAEGSKEFQDDRGTDWQEEFDIPVTWTIPADIGANLEGWLEDFLSDLRKHKGPDEPTIQGPDVDDLDEGIDDPSEVGLTQERTDFFKQEGYVYKADYKGNPHWEKKWPLPLPIKTGKTTLTDLMIHPGHGQIWYSLVDAAGRPKGGYSITLPRGDVTPYSTSLRRALLKMRHVAERMPVDANFNDMFTFLRVAFDKVEDEVESESHIVHEGEDDFDYENYVKTSANYNPVQLLSAADVRKIIGATGYRINSLYHSKRTTGYSLRIMPGNAEQFQAMKEQPDREANRMLDQIRQGIIARLPMLGKIERGMYNIDDKLTVHCWHWGDARYKDVPDDPRNFLLYVDIQPIDHQRRGPKGKMLPEGVDDPEGYVNKLERAQYCPRCLSHETKCIGTHSRLPGGYGSGEPQEFWECGACGDKFLWSDERSVGFKLESVADPDDPEAMLQRTHMAKMGDLVDVVCPTCGDRRQLFKNWPDGTKDWGSACAKCGSFIPLPNMVVDSLADPDADLNPEEYANDTLNVDQILTSRGYRNMSEAHFPHWQKYITPNMQFVVFYEGGTKWQFQVYRPVVSGEWKLKTSSPGREISTIRADLDMWEKKARAGTLLGVNESDEDIDPQDYAKTTFDIVHFLKERGWELHSIASREYYAKTFPMPKPYQLGGMTFTGVQVRVGVNMFATGETWIGLYFVDSTNNGMPVHAFDLEMQQLFPWEDSDVPPMSYFDNKMPIRRFVAGLDDVLANVEWPDVPVALKASNRVLRALDRFITSLNQQANKPLHPEVREIGENVDEPDDTEITRRMRELPPANYRELVVPLDRVQEMEAILTQPAASQRIRGYVAFDEEVVFGDRKRMAIQVIASESDDETGWSQGVLYDAEGNELGNTDVGESFLGEFTVADEGTNYTVNVVPEPMTEALDPDDPESVLQQLPQHTYVTFTRSREEDQEIAEGNFPDLPLEQALTQQLLRELAESKLFDMATVKASGIKIAADVYTIRLLFLGYASDAELRGMLQAAYREVGVAGDFNIEQFRHEPTQPNQWIAKGWESPVIEALDPDDPELVLQSHPGFEFRQTSYLGTMVFIKGPGEDKSDWPQDIGRLIYGPEPNPPYARKRWYVIGVRGIVPERLDEYGFGIHKHAGLRTFDTKEDAAMAIWLTWSRLPHDQQRGYLLPNT